ncbi:MAG: hypothetical protein OYH77_02055 [Pseudomonadota bacterium]|nr:hypothetical protein [Pseudomonadota bacterium]
MLVLQTSFASSAPRHQHQHQQIELLYLHELGTRIITAATKLASLSPQSTPDLQINSLPPATMSPGCAAVRDKWQQLTQATQPPPIASEHLFQHFSMTALLLWHINRNLYQLSKQIYAHNTQATTSPDKSTQQLLKEKIKLLNDQMQTLLTTDSMALLAKHGKYRFFQKIAQDYYELTMNQQLTGIELLKQLEARNRTILDDIIKQLLTRMRHYLHHAWQHSCVQKKRLTSHNRLVFYLKHPQLVESVEERLSARQQAAHTELKQSLADRVSTKHFKNSAVSFFGLVGGLTIPAYLVPRRLNKYTLPTMALTGAALTYLKTKILVDTRKQLEIGAFVGLNDFAHYHDFRINTSVSKYVFAHLAATSLAIVLRSMPRPKGDLFYADTAFLARMNFFGSVMTMYSAEAIQQRKFDLWRDKNFRHNMFIVLVIDTTLGLISSMGLPNEVRISVAAAVTILASISAHVFAGKEINWDRIVYDTTYVSTYSLYKSIFLYTGGSRFLIKRLGLDSKASHTALMVGMSALSNVVGNFPYSFLARQWIEKMDAYNFSPLHPSLDNPTTNDDLQQAIKKIITKHGFDEDILQ